MNPRRVATIAHFVVLTICVSALGCSRSDDAKTTGGVPAPSTPVATATAEAKTAGDAVRPTSTDDETYALSSSSRWQVGDVVTSVMKKTVTANVTSTRADGSTVPVAAVDETVNATLVEKCTKVDDDGLRAQSLVYVRDWVRQSGDTRDESLKGSSISVTTTASDRKWSFLGKGKDPSAEAKRWVEDYVRSSVAEERLQSIIMPNKRVAVGERWALDMEPLAETFAQVRSPISQFKSSATATLIGVRGDTAEYGLKATLQLLSVPDSRLTWTRGGAVELDGSFTLPLRGRLRVPSTAKSTSTVEGAAQDEQSDFLYDFRSSDERSTTLGGELPDIEEPDDGDEPAQR